MLRRLCTGFCLLLFFIQARAIQAEVFHTLFYQQDPHTYKLVPVLETYWQITPQSIHYTTNTENKIIGRVYTHILLYADTGKIAEDNFVLQTVPRADVNDLGGHPIMDLRRYTAATGKVYIKIAFTDIMDTANHYTYRDSINIPLTPATTPFYSDLQFLDTAYESNAKTRFLKQGRQQVPVCANFIDDNRHTLKYYAELYNTEKISRNDYPLVQTIFISKNENAASIEDFIQHDTIQYKQLINTSGQFKAAGLASGNYFLNVTLEGVTGNSIAHKSIFFQRLNKHYSPDAVATAKTNLDTVLDKVNVLNLSKTFVSKFTFAQVKAVLKMMLPLSDATGVQTIKGFLNKPDEMYMRYYIYNYFSSANPKDPGKAWKEYADKIKEVNKRYSSQSIPGYETSRGFVYLRYGAPSDVITVENENGSLPYEIWQYNILVQINRKEITNGLFLFYKPEEMTGDFKLLTTNVGGEIQNPGWRSYLAVNAQGTPTGSRADEYFEQRK